MTVIIDYGVGNLFSLCRSFEKIGEKAYLSKNESDIKNADRIILPGVGAFKDAAEKLSSSGMIPVIKESVARGVPILGICLGMQLLFERSHEYGISEGLKFIKGEIKPISSVSPDVKIPHMGWNPLIFNNGTHPLFKYIKNGSEMYFVHSYYADTDDKNIIAKAEYGAEITAAVADKNIMGCQFHPEKSGNAGLCILKSFCEMKEGDLC